MWVAGEQLTQNETRLDGFSQPNLICKQQTLFSRSQELKEGLELVWLELSAARSKSIQRVL